jgi:hypothetical protein
MDGRRTNDRPEAYFENLRNRINAGQAVDLINKAMMELDVKPSALSTAVFVLNKMLPNFSAIAVQLETKAAVTLNDLADRANRLGLDPSLLLGQPIESIEETVSSVPDKVVSCEDSSEAPLPPDVDA